MDASALETFATRATIWLAMLCYTGSVTVLLTLPHKQKIACLLYVGGFAAFVLHAAFAFHSFYDWSHATAWMETRRQTETATGIDSGSGIYFNYALGIIWMIDAMRWVKTRHPIHAGSRIGAGFVHGFFLFMLVNGGILFASGPVRWFTGALLIVMLSAAIYRFRRRPG